MSCCDEHFTAFVAELRACTEDAVVFYQTVIHECQLLIDYNDEKHDSKVANYLH